MNKVLRIYLLMVAALMASSCSDRRQAELVRQAEQIVYEQPDSALHLLQNVRRKSLRGESLARYALVYSIVQDKNGIDVANDSLLRIAYDYYSQYPEDSLYARSQYYMGRYLWLTAQTDSAYSCLLKAKTASEAEKDYYTAYLATDGLRRVAEVSDTSLCLRLSQEAYQLYVQQGTINSVNEVYLLIGIGDSYLRRNEGDSAIHYYNRALELARLTEDSVAVSSVLQNISLFYNRHHQNEKALEYARQTLEYRGYLDQSLAMLLAQCYTENEEYDKARQYLHAIQQDESKETQLVVLNMLHTLSARTGDADAAQEYFDSAINVAADMYLSTQKEKLNLHHRNMQEEMARQQAEYLAAIYAITIAFLIVVIILAVWLFVKYHRSKRAEIEHQKTVNRMSEEAHEKEKVHKEQIMERTRYYVRNMVDILRMLEQYRNEQRIQKSKDVLSNSKGKEEKKFRLELNEKAWADIEAYLEACDDSFVSRFREKYPEISRSDFQLCMLLRCGFSNPELELVYSITPQSIKTKQRILKERLTDVDGGLSLRQYVIQF